MTLLFLNNWALLYSNFGTYLNISEADEDTILDSPLTPASLSDDVDTELINDSVMGVWKKIDTDNSIVHLNLECCFFFSTQNSPQILDQSVIKCASYKKGMPFFFPVIWPIYTIFQSISNLFPEWGKKRGGRQNWPK